MKLIDFEKEIDEIIVQRGKAYYPNVKWLKQIEAGKWLAEVMGSDCYHVTVVLENEMTITETSCDCPYNWGNYCKHQVAVFYGLKAILSGEDKEENQSVDKVLESSQQELVKLLEKQTKATLVELLANYAASDYQIRRDLQMKFLPQSATDKLTLQRAKKLLDGNIGHGEWGGFISYQEAEELAEEALEVLALCRQLSAAETLAKIEICLLVIEGLLVDLPNSDDSLGDMSGAIDDGVYLIQEILARGAKECRDQEKEIRLILTSLEQKVFEDWSDYRLDLLASCVLASQTNSEKKALEKMIRLIKNQYSVASFYSEYVRQELEKMQYQLLLKFEDNQVANAYLLKHIANPEFRRIAIKEARANEEYDQALFLCQQGEKINQDHVKLVIEWQEQRYQLYQLLGNNEAQKKLAEELLMKGLNVYYSQLKKLCTRTEWSIKLSAVLTDLEIRPEQQALYRFILFEEGLKNDLLRYCQIHVVEIADLYTELLPEYEKEALAIYADYIRTEATKATTRKHYQELCRLLRSHKKSCGVSHTRTIVNELESNYKRKPALLDELSRLVL